ncbi:uncharacterized protein LOC144633613 [Oculina patagonica]
MSSSTLIEVFGHIVFSFTRGVTEHYNPEEPEFTAESFGYDPLQSTGREWYYLPVDELIYQEYSDREATSSDYLASSRLNVRVIDACSPEENEGTQGDQQNEERAMAWKRLRPSALRTVCKSMYIGALICFLSAVVIGMLYILVSYLCYKTIFHCHLHPQKLIPKRVQWIKTISEVISCVFYYIMPFFILLLLFRPFQLKGVKRKLFLVGCVMFCFDSLYRVAFLAVAGKPYGAAPSYFQIPLYIFFITNLCIPFYLLGRHFCVRPRTKLATMIFKMATPICFPFIAAFVVSDYLYPAYNKQNDEGKLIIALFAPLIGVAIETMSRICVQRLWNYTHPGFSYVLLAPMYYTYAVLFRVLQADLEGLQSIAILGIIHGAAEVIERSAMVVIDHICHVIWKRTSASWGSFRTPRRERLMADIAILSMLSESSAIVSVNGFLYLYQYVYLQNDSLLKLLQSFAIYTSVQLVIEWCFTSVSLAIETRYQNMAVMAVWRRRWKRCILVGIILVIPGALWTSSNIFRVVQGRFHDEPLNRPCKMPFH